MSTLLGAELNKGFDVVSLTGDTLPLDCGDTLLPLLGRDRSIDIHERHRLDDLLALLRTRQKPGAVTVDELLVEVLLRFLRLRTAETVTMRRVLRHVVAQEPRNRRESRPWTLSLPLPLARVAYGHQSPRKRPQRLRTAEAVTMRRVLRQWPRSSAIDEKRRPRLLRALAPLPPAAASSTVSGILPMRS